MNYVDAIRCAHCGLEVPSGDETPRKPCKNCGSTKRNVSVSITESIHMSDSIQWVSRREYYEKNKKVLAVVILIAVGSPLLGLVVAGVPGVFVGFTLSAISYFLGPYAVTKVREIERGS